jgi:hypothetical protein
LAANKVCAFDFCTANAPDDNDRRADGALAAGVLWLSSRNQKNEQQRDQPNGLLSDEGTFYAY